MEADIYYRNIILEVLKNGYWDKGMDVRPKWLDGTPAYSKSIIGKELRFDNFEIPILTQKEVKWKSAIKEILWIWQMKSNIVQDLRDMGVNIWNEWEKKDGTIGRAYGYQLRQPNRYYPKEKINWNLIDKKTCIEYEDYVMIDQVDYLIHSLINNPSSRRHITTLWNVGDLDYMSLNPCVYETQWHVKNNKLHLEVRCRSNDLGLGHPFNVFQYNILQRMIAQVTGYELGEYIFHIGDAHIYDRHIDILKEQINNTIYPAPKLWINPKIKSFYDFSIDDFKLINYKHGPFLKMEVAK